MDDEKKKLDQNFRDSSSLTEEQRRQVEIKLVRNADERNRIAALVAERNRELEAQKESHTEERNKIVDDRVKKEVKNSPELKPPGMEDTRSVEERVAAIERDVDAKLQPAQEKERLGLEESHNKKIDQELASARAREREQSLSTNRDQSRDR